MEAYVSKELNIHLYLLDIQEVKNNHFHLKVIYFSFITKFRGRILIRTNNVDPLLHTEF